ncbi:hypothetical protein [Bifidobacterium dentium]|nr:hypothetical protein [Bifidobacterium dentium]MBF9695544.1 hypothetical protein [Bifidobacterium dentium]MBF9713666.1 hypothetical protein [Bifidobacterium dentium]MBF9717636.1 hypothetical protein [Bifidobacterium dentium]
MFETHTPVETTPSAIAAALSNFHPAEPEPVETADVGKLRRSIRVARRDRDHWKRKAKRYEKKINNIKEFLK